MSHPHFHYCQVHGVNHCSGHHHLPHPLHHHIGHEPEWVTATKAVLLVGCIVCAVTGIDPGAIVTSAVLSSFGGGKS